MAKMNKDQIAVRAMEAVKVLFTNNFNRNLGGLVDAISYIVEDYADEYGNNSVYQSVNYKIPLGKDQNIGIDVNKYVENATDNVVADITNIFNDEDVVTDGLVTPIVVYDIISGCDLYMLYNDATSLTYDETTGRIYHTYSEYMTQTGDGEYIPSHQFKYDSFITDKSTGRKACFVLWKVDSYNKIDRNLLIRRLCECVLSDYYISEHYCGKKLTEIITDERIMLEIFDLVDFLYQVVEAIAYNNPSVNDKGVIRMRLNQIIKSIRDNAVKFKELYLRDDKIADYYWFSDRYSNDIEELVNVALSFTERSPFIKTSHDIIGNIKTLKIDNM